MTPPKPPFCSLSINPPRPSSRPPPPSCEVGCVPALAGRSGSRFLNKAPDASRASSASISGLPMLPPGAALRILSSIPAMALTPSLVADGSGAAATRHCVVAQEHHDRTDDCDNHAPDVQAGHARCAEQIKQKSADQSTDDPERDVEPETLAPPMDDLT